MEMARCFSHTAVMGIATNLKGCHITAKDTTQMTTVLQLSRTMRVVALISFVTLIPEKLKNAILMMLPENKTWHFGQEVFFFFFLPQLLAQVKRTRQTTHRAWQRWSRGCFPFEWTRPGHLPSFHLDLYWWAFQASGSTLGSVTHPRRLYRRTLQFKKQLWVDKTLAHLWQFCKKRHKVNFV